MMSLQKQNSLNYIYIFIIYIVHLMSDCVGKILLRKLAGLFKEIEFEDRTDRTEFGYRTD